MNLSGWQSRFFFLFHISLGIFINWLVLLISVILGIFLIVRSNANGSLLKNRIHIGDKLQQWQRPQTMELSFFCVCVRSERVFPSSTMCVCVFVHKMNQKLKGLLCCCSSQPFFLLFFDGFQNNLLSAFLFVHFFFSSFSFHSFIYCQFFFRRLYIFRWCFENATSRVRAYFGVWDGKTKYTKTN